MNYSCGLVFNQNNSKLAMIKKNRPWWQKGRYNGVGGKVEGTETYIECMIRETKEEMGLDTNEEDWVSLGRLIINDSNVMFFAIFGIDFYTLKQITDEEIYIISVKHIFDIKSDVYNLIMPNIRTAIGLVLDKRDNINQGFSQWII